MLPLVYTFHTICKLLLYRLSLGSIGSLALDNADADNSSSLYGIETTLRIDKFGATYVALYAL